LILGGGSNILFTKDFDGLVIKSSLSEKKIIEETTEHVLLEAASGEEWHSLVLFCIERNWGGLENLSLIPGLVGAAPIQNIGAYGVEMKDTCEYVEAIELSNGKIHRFPNEDCRFDYRDSIFKNEWKNKFLITAAAFRLSKHPKLNLKYGDVKHTLQEMRINIPTIRDVSNAVIKIRTSKLPDPKVIPNAGSFFKNPSVSNAFVKSLLKKYPLMPNHPQRSTVKIPAGWLVEQCGWKGKRFGDAGVHERQALVLVNYGNATGEEILQLSKKIRQSVLEKFGIELQTEVNIV
jgi:UDP-N-acetylmuramate dehydrogenase